MTMLKDYREGPYSVLVDYSAPGKNGAAQYKYFGSVPAGGFQPPGIAQRYATLEQLPIPRDVMMAGVSRMEARFTLNVYAPEVFAYIGLHGVANGVTNYCKFLFLEVLASEGSLDKKQKRWEIDGYIVNPADGPPSADGLATTEITLSVMRCTLADAVFSNGVLGSAVRRLTLDAASQSFITWVNDGQTAVDHLAGIKEILEVGLTAAG